MVFSLCAHETAMTLSETIKILETPVLQFSSAFRPKYSYSNVQTIHNNVPFQPHSENKQFLKLEYQI